MPNAPPPSIFRRMTPSKMREPTARVERDHAGRTARADVGASEVVLTVNGQRRALAGGATVADLLRALDLDPRMIVVEHNGEILRHDVTAPVHALRTGDVVELVHFVGGG
jgi:thiamine biosynthesis protein ThiS